MGLPWLPVVVVEEVAVGKLGRPESIGLTRFSAAPAGIFPARFRISWILGPESIGLTRFSGPKIPEIPENLGREKSGMTVTGG